MSYIRHICLTGLISLGQFASAEISPELAEAASPLTGGVPEVAVARLQAFFEPRGKPLPQVAVAWVLQQPGITSAIVGADAPKNGNVQRAALP